MIFFLVISLVGCNAARLGGKTIIRATVSKVGENMLDVKKPHISYNQKNSTELATFAKAIKRAKKVDGVVDVTAPDYLLTLTFKDNTTSEYSLWLGEDSGAIMDEKDTYTIYILPSYLIAKLNKYVK